jgi:hypothetical protein
MVAPAQVLAVVVPIVLMSVTVGQRRSRGNGDYEGERDRN